MGRWLLASGGAARAEALCEKALRRLVLDVEPDAFAASFTAGARKDSSNTP